MEEAGLLIDFKDFDWKNATNEDIVRFGKTTDFGEPGISLSECWTLVKALESTGGRPLTIFETGMCYGTTTRIFIAWTLKYGGSVHSAEIHVRPLFKQKMEEAGYWQYVNPMGDSRHLNWDRNKPIDFLFIDSEHALEDALGEYMYLKKYVPVNGVVGFHDYNCCPGVKFAVNIISFIDLLHPVAYDTGTGAGIIFYQLLRHNVGGEWLGKAKTIAEDIELNKRRMIEANESTPQTSL